MDFKPSHRLNGVQESATLKLNALVQQLKSQGKDVVNLTAGEPDFNVPEAVKAAAILAIQENRSKYTAVAGIAELREKIAQKTNAQQPSLSSTFQWTAANVMVTNGAKQALFEALQALLNEGDEVIILAPYWLSYPEMVRLAGGVPKVLETRFEDQYRLDLSVLQSAISFKTKAILFNSPSNPTGAVWSRADFQAVGNFLETNELAKNIAIISDEIYDRLVYTPTPFVSFLEACPKLKDRTLTINGLSKSAAMTGWRVGWAVGPKAWISAMGIIQGQATSNINSVMQYASLAALELPESLYSEWVSTYQKRRDAAIEVLKGLGPNVRVFKPEGAFYIWIDASIPIQAHGYKNATDFCEAVLQKEAVALISGESFGAPNWVRMSFALNEKVLTEGCRRLLKGFAT